MFCNLKETKLQSPDTELKSPETDFLFFRHGDPFGAGLKLCLK